MSLQNKVPVEQLDDERLTNIERKLVVAVSDMRAPERSPRRLLAFAGVTAAVCVAAVVGYKLRPHAETVAPVAVAEVAQRFAVNTDNGSSIDLGNAVLASAPGSQLVVERTRTRVVIEMTRGSLDMNVKHDPSRVLLVRAGDTEIEDIGTRFSVDYDGASKVLVRVTEGEVQVKRAGMQTEVGAGFAWTADKGRLAIAELDAAASTQVVASTVPVPTTDRASNATATAPAVSNPAVAPAHPVAPNGDTEAVGSGSATPVHKAGKSNARVALEKLPIEEPLDVGTKDFNTAIAKYLDLAVSMGEGQDKTQVLYSIAVVQHRAHQDKAALYTLSGVIKRQGGKAYKEALWLNVRIECMQHFDDECRQAADLYLRKVPDGVAAGVAQTILTEIDRNP